MDFEGRQVFAFIYLFFCNVSFNSGGVSAEDFHRWVQNVAKIEFKIQRPIDWQKFLLYGTASLSALSVLSALYRNFQTLFSNKRLWTVISVAWTVVFCSGHMWNSIRGPPMVGRQRDGQPELFAPGQQSQYVVESQIIAVICKSL